LTKQKTVPTTSTFKMNSGQSSYVWQLGALTDIEMDRGSGSASTRYCKVQRDHLPYWSRHQLNTEDSKVGGGPKSVRQIPSDALFKCGAGPPPSQLRLG
jgi:hypothetical protein